MVPKKVANIAAFLFYRYKSCVNNDCREDKNIISLEIQDFKSYLNLNHR